MYAGIVKIKFRVQPPTTCGTQLCSKFQEVLGIDSIDLFFQTN